MCRPDHLQSSEMQELPCFLQQKKQVTEKWSSKYSFFDPFFFSPGISSSFQPWSTQLGNGNFVRCPAGKRKPMGTKKLGFQDGGDEIHHFGDLFFERLFGRIWMVFFPHVREKNIEGLRFNLLWKPTWLTKHLISSSEGRLMPLFLAFRGFQWGPIRFWWAILAGLSPIFSRGEIS